MRVSVFAIVLACCNGSPSSAATPPSSGSPSPSAALVADSAARGVCRYTNGAIAAAGVVAPSSDGCNTCSCGTNSWWQCTELACPRR